MLALIACASACNSETCAERAATAVDNPCSCFLSAFTWVLQLGPGFGLAVQIHIKWRKIQKATDLANQQPRLQGKRWLRQGRPHLGPCSSLSSHSPALYDHPIRYKGMSKGSVGLNKLIMRSCDIGNHQRADENETIYALAYRIFILESYHAQVKQGLDSTKASNIRIPHSNCDFTLAIMISSKRPLRVRCALSIPVARCPGGRKGSWVNPRHNDSASELQR
jgi:hypothetical protein